MKPVHEGNVVCDIPFVIVPVIAHKCKKCDKIAA